MSIEGMLNSFFRHKATKGRHTVQHGEKGSGKEVNYTQAAIPASRSLRDRLLSLSTAGLAGSVPILNEAGGKETVRKSFEGEEALCEAYVALRGEPEGLSEAEGLSGELAVERDSLVLALARAVLATEEGEEYPENTLAAAQTARQEQAEEAARQANERAERLKASAAEKKAKKASRKPGNASA